MPFLLKYGDGEALHDAEGKRCEFSCVLGHLPSLAHLHTYIRNLTHAHTHKQKHMSTWRFVGVAHVELQHRLLLFYHSAVMLALVPLLHSYIKAEIKHARLLSGHLFKVRQSLLATRPREYYLEFELPIRLFVAMQTLCFANVSRNALHFDVVRNPRHLGSVLVLAFGGRRWLAISARKTCVGGGCSVFTDFGFELRMCRKWQ